ncbi:hypothetical protein DK842_01445 [Chromobacterium phragmitis]|nr:hypothetical protein DK842_01445 [Chromobacterium phragmitis]
MFPLLARQYGLQHKESSMANHSLSRFFQHYLRGQRKLLGIDPQQALSRLNEVMQWEESEKKAAGANRPQAEEQGIRIDSPREG